MAVMFDEYHRLVRGELAADAATHLGRHGLCRRQRVPGQGDVCEAGVARTERYVGGRRHGIDGVDLWGYCASRRSTMGLHAAG